MKIQLSKLVKKIVFEEISTIELCCGVRVKDYGNRLRREGQGSVIQPRTQRLLFSKHFVDPKEAFHHFNV